MDSLTTRSGIAIDVQIPEPKPGLIILTIDGDSVLLHWNDAARLAELLRRSAETAKKAETERHRQESRTDIARAVGELEGRRQDERRALIVAEQIERERLERDRLREHRIEYQDNRGPE